MKRIFTLVCISLSFFIKFAEAKTESVFTGKEWYGDKQTEVYRIVEVNREKPTVDSIPYDTVAHAIDGSRDYNKSLSPFYKLLSQKEWKFKIYNSPALFEASKDTDFFKSGYDVTFWDNLFVPSNWQIINGEHRYDKAIYTNFKLPWDGDNNGNPKETPESLPNPPIVYNPVGLYRTHFSLTATDIANRNTYIVFEGVSSCIYLWINGKAVGYAEDSKTAKSFDISQYVVEGENVLAAEVIRWCKGSYLEDQDYVRLSGISRDVYVYSAPRVRIQDFCIVTDFDSTYTDSIFKVEAQIKNNSAAAVTNDYELEVSLYDADKQPVSYASDKAFTIPIPGIASRSDTIISGQAMVSRPNKWNVDDPYLYTTVLQLKYKGKPIDIQAYQTGFRKITFRKDTASGETGQARFGDTAELIRINGVPITFRGVNRHDGDPLNGNAVSKEIMEKDVQIMKNLNINAIRTSHYPNDPYLYYLTDKYGFYVMDEANMEAHENEGRPELTTYCYEIINDRITNMIYRDRNHASIVMWSVGNESKAPDVIKELPEKVHDMEPTRPVHYEQLNDGYGVDISSHMYWEYTSVIDYANNPQNNLSLILCEYAHAMGNSAGGLKEYVEAFDTYDNLQGGFLWDFADQTLWTKTGGYDRIFGLSKNDSKVRLSADNVKINETGSNAYMTGYGTVASKKVNVIGNAITVATRVRFNKPTDSSRLHHYDVVAKGDSQYALKFKVGGGSVPSCEFFIYDASSQSKYIVASWEIPESKLSDWYDVYHDMVGTYDGKTIKLYVDGMEVATRDAVGVITPNSYDLGINVNLERDNERKADAQVQCVKILNKRYTLNELASLDYKDPSTVAWFDFRDFDTVKEAIPEITFLGYGGDWNDSPNDGNFCQNGIVRADRVLDPEAYEVQYQYRNIKFKELSIDVDGAKLEVKNYNPSVNANTYNAKYSILEDGKVIKTAAIVGELLDIEPNSAKEIYIPFDIERNTSGAEYFLEFYYEKQGPVIGGEQTVEISKDQFAIPATTNQSPPTIPLSDIETVIYSELDDKVTVSNSTFLLVLNKKTGTISSYNYKGNEMFTEGPAPNFWRAPLDNDKASSDLNRGLSWRFAGSSATVGTIKVTPINVDGETKAVEVVVSFIMNTVGDSKLTTKYYITGNGEVKIDNRLITDSRTVELPKIGTQMVLADGYDKFEFLGRGPKENYIDRNSGSFVGRYKSTVADDYYAYAKPQDHGNRSDMRWLAMTKDNGDYGLLFIGNKTFEGSALHYKAEAMTGYRHWHEMEPSENSNTVLNIDHIQRGVGSRTCGPDTLVPYRIYGGEHNYGYRFIGFKVTEDPGELALKPSPSI